MKITGIDCHVLVDPGFDIRATSSAQDDIVLEIHTDEGLTGIGETDVNPWIARECIQAPGTHTMGQGLTEMLIGADPLSVEDLWERLYVGSAMNGRRGAVINAIGAIDMALHDLRGKLLVKPCHALLGAGPPRDSVTPTPPCSLRCQASTPTATRWPPGHATRSKEGSGQPRSKSPCQAPMLTPGCTSPTNAAPK